MIYDVIEVEVRSDYKVFVRFQDGMQGEVDISKLVPFKGVFAPLQNREYFAQVFVDSDSGTICWQNGADIAPETLYAAVREAAA